jgi:DNA-binding Lrp family transcriptional regulator
MIKPQDILVLLKIVAIEETVWTQQRLAEELKISPAEISGVFDRCVEAGFINQAKDRVNKQSLKEFLVHGLKYVFPPKIGAKTRGIATAHSASPIKEHIHEGEDNFVWPYYKGTKRGMQIEPLYKTIPEIASGDPVLYELLVIVDTLRVGRVREVEIAVLELDKRLGNGN